jgi:hypothetical protein
MDIADLVREPIPPTVREPRRKWPLLVAGLLLAVALGGAALAERLGYLRVHPRWLGGLLGKPASTATKGK